MATQVDWYVDTDYTGGGNNGTITNPYTSLSAAEAAKQADLTAATGNDTFVVFHCKGAAADTTAVTFVGWTTAADNYIEVRTDSSDATGRHAGVWNTGTYRLEVTGTDALSIVENYVRLDGLQVKCVSPGGTSQAIYVPSGGVDAGNDVRISNCIVACPGNASYAEYGIRVGDSDANVQIWNCVVYGASANAGSIAINVGDSATVNIYNCTVQSGTYGVYRGAGTVVAKNTYSAGSSGKAFSGTITQTKCAASDTTATDAALDNVALSTDNFVNVTAGSENFHLAGTGSALYGTGADNTGDSAPLNYTTDIDGHTINGRFDIGADWYYVAAPTGQFARPSSDVAGGTFRSIHVTAPFGPRVIA